MTSPIRIIAVLCLLLELAAPARAASGSRALDTFFDGLVTLQADFRQQIYDPRGKLVQQADGHLWVQRPGRFRWDYRKPYAQVILADGKDLWTYDEDLAQVTVKPLGQALAGTPAMLLSQAQPPETLFKVTDLGVADGLQWVGLTPRSHDTEYSRIRLGFGPDGLAAMDLVDAFGQTTRFSFEHVERNRPISAARFHFTPPPGADVVGQP